MPCGKARSRCLLDDVHRTPMTYSLLLGYYLGDGYVATHSNGTERLRVFFDDAYPNIAREGRDAIGIVGSSRARLAYTHPGTSHCLEASGYSKHWSCVFPQHGPGRKHTRRIELADWQREIVDEFPEQFLRGLFMSDGCRVMNQGSNGGTRIPATCSRTSPPTSTRSCGEVSTV